MDLHETRYLRLANGIYGVLQPSQTVDITHLKLTNDGNTEENVYDDVEVPATLWWRSPYSKFPTTAMCMINSRGQMVRWTLGNVYPTHQICFGRNDTVNLEDACAAFFGSPFNRDLTDSFNYRNTSTVWKKDMPSINNLFSHILSPIMGGALFSMTYIPMLSCCSTEGRRMGNNKELWEFVIAESKRCIEANFGRAKVWMDRLHGLVMSPSLVSDPMYWDEILMRAVRNSTHASVARRSTGPNTLGRQLSPRFKWADLNTLSAGGLTFDGGLASHMRRFNEVGGTIIRLATVEEETSLDIPFLKILASGSGVVPDHRVRTHHDYVVIPREIYDLVCDKLEYINRLMFEMLKAMVHEEHQAVVGPLMERCAESKAMSPYFDRVYCAKTLMRAVSSGESYFNELETSLGEMTGQRFIHNVQECFMHDKVVEYCEQQTGPLLTDVFPGIEEVDQVPSSVAWLRHGGGGLQHYTARDGLARGAIDALRSMMEPEQESSTMSDYHELRIRYGIARAFGDVVIGPFARWNRRIMDNWGAGVPRAMADLFWGLTPWADGTSQRASLGVHATFRVKVMFRNSRSYAHIEASALPGPRIMQPPPEVRFSLESGSLSNAPWQALKPVALSYSTRDLQAAWRVSAPLYFGHGLMDPLDRFVRWFCDNIDSITEAHARGYKPIFVFESDCWALTHEKTEMVRIDHMTWDSQRLALTVNRDRPVHRDPNCYVDCDDRSWITACDTSLYILNEDQIGVSASFFETIAHLSDWTVVHERYEAGIDNLASIYIVNSAPVCIYKDTVLVQKSDGTWQKVTHGETA